MLDVANCVGVSSESLVSTEYVALGLGLAVLCGHGASYAGSYPGREEWQFEFGLWFIAVNFS